MDWFTFFTRRALGDQDMLKHFIEHLFWNKKFEDIDAASMKMGLATVATGCELFEPCDELQFYKSITDRIVETICVNCKTTDNLLPFARINNLHTNHIPTTPLFRIYPVHLLGAIARLYGDIRLSKYAKYSLNHGITLYRQMTPNKRKLLFIHGIGLGLVPYLNFIDKLECADYELVLVELTGISGQNVDADYYPTAQQIVETIVNEFDGNDVVDGIGHSAGTIVLSYITNQQPEFLRKRVFIDTPVFFPDTTKFWPILFEPVTWTKIIKLMSQGKYIRAASDFIFAEQWNQHLTHNSTYFYEYCNREYNLDENTLILLGEYDHFINPRTIETYIKQHYPNVYIYVFDRYKHGDATHRMDYIRKHLNTA
jgi:pimeloyl-ACP methyl ester carboxylesterase